MPAKRIRRDRGIIGLQTPIVKIALTEALTEVVLVVGPRTSPSKIDHRACHARKRRHIAFCFACLTTTYPHSTRVEKRSRRREHYIAPCVPVINCANKQQNRRAQLTKAPKSDIPFGFHLKPRCPSSARHRNIVTT